MDKLIALLETNLSYARKWSASGECNPDKMFDQAFGAVEMFCLLFPELEEECADLWNETYRPRFEEIIFGY